MEKLINIRIQIDKIDDELLLLIKRRSDKVKEIKKIKNNLELSIKDSKREKEILKKTNNDYEMNIMKKIISESRKLQS